MSEYERNQMTPDDVARAIANGDYMRKNGDTSKAPEPKNEADYAPCYDMVGMCGLCMAA